MESLTFRLKNNAYLRIGSHCKVNMPNSAIYLDWTPICEWYMAMCGSKTGRWKDICSKESIPYAPKLLTILVSIVSTNPDGVGGVTYLEFLWF